MRRTFILLGLTACMTLPVNAQWSFGPQVSGMGVGGSVTRKLVVGFFSASGEIGFAPVGTTNVSLEGVRYTLEPTVTGGLAMLNLHPFRSGFSVGAGYMFGGYTADARTPDDEGAYALDGNTYTVDQYGTLSGRFELRGPVPALMIGWRGSGFNFGVGVSLIEPAVSLSADGTRSMEPDFQAALERERLELEDALQLQLFGFKGIPLVRLGWELGV